MKSQNISETIENQLTEQEINEALDPKNLSPVEQQLVEAWKESGLTPERMAELLIYEM